MFLLGQIWEGVRSREWWRIDRLDREVNPGPQELLTYMRRQYSAPCGPWGSLPDRGASSGRCLHLWENLQLQVTMASSYLLSPKPQVHHHPGLYTCPSLSPSPACGTRRIFLGMTSILLAAMWNRRATVNDCEWDLKHFLNMLLFCLAVFWFLFFDFFFL